MDFDIEKYFDTVNHDKLISILREQVNDSATLHLVRSFLKAGVMENGLVHTTSEGVPQGGCISPILSNIYLDLKVEVSDLSVMLMTSTSLLRVRWQRTE